MDFVQVVKKRYMIREYQDKPVEDEKLAAILDLAKRFPSAGHTQPQEFIVVSNPKIKKALYQAALHQEYVLTAPVLIVVVADSNRSSARYGERGIKKYSLIDGAFASMLVLLSAVNLGLGACFVGAFIDSEVAAILKLPKEVIPIGIITLGYAAEGPVKYPRRSFSEIVHQEQW